ncbi:hypothetical protein ILUMI_22235 [Ignelater luminosus]|uniref:BACK domain-containing protein n=1 Tax=Ignelater luminosus TaxID=2038154 RepID=A0A8K0CB07_IGNLU|nr:hypothetical protein ILUMI_22235 [Ignelater luminosus]
MCLKRCLSTCIQTMPPSYHQITATNSITLQRNTCCHSCKKNCIEFLQSNINAENACRGYEFAKLFDEPSFMKQCLDFIKYQGTSVLTETSLKDVKLTTIITILDQHSLNVDSEVTLFKAVEMCADNNEKHVTESTDENSSNELDEQHSLLREALKKIRFLAMTPQQFAEGPALSNLLTQSEKFGIFMNISSPACFIPMPQGFSRNRNPRHVVFKTYENAHGIEAIFAYRAPSNWVLKE